MIGASNRSPHDRQMAPPGIPVIVYGTRWCAATQLVRRYLDRLGVPYEYVDLDVHPEAAVQLRWWTGGYARFYGVRRRRGARRADDVGAELGAVSKRTTLRTEPLCILPSVYSVPRLSPGPERSAVFGSRAR